ncbi:MAG: hypothetical protein ACK5LC_08250 [Coprobacillaceae bacterium]
MITVDKYEKISKTKSLIIKGEQKVLEVYKIPISELKYNLLNDRILTQFTSEEREKLNGATIEEQNQMLEELIWSSAPKENEKTMLNIKQFGQREPGVVMSDGTIVDGNRRYTCIRRLFNEDPQQKNGYYEACILSDEYKLTDKELKTLELNIQHGEEEKVKYDPINRSVAAFRDIEQNKLFTLKEYANSTSSKESDVKKDVEAGKLIHEFLEYSNNDENYKIASDLKLDGPIRDISNAIKKSNNEDIKEYAFDFLLLNKKDHKTIRPLLKEISNIEKSPKHVERHEMLRDQIHEALESNENKISELRKMDQLRKEVFTNFNDFEEKSRMKSVSPKTKKDLDRIIKTIQRLDLDELKVLAESDIEITKLIHQMRLAVETVELGLRDE